MRTTVFKRMEVGRLSQVNFWELSSQIRKIVFEQIKVNAVVFQMRSSGLS